MTQLSFEEMIAQLMGKEPTPSDGEQGQPEAEVVGQPTTTTQISPQDRAAITDSVDLVWNE